MQPHEAFDIVRRSRSNERLPHAYLIVGDPRGDGNELSLQIASLLLCTEGDRAPCGSCDACRRIQSGSHPDVFTLEPEKKSRIISVDAMRENMLAWSEKQSFLGGWKIGRILFADRLNDSAANAFLKTLEEPPPSTLFLLVTDKPEALLPTIISRCQRLDLAAGRRAPPEPWRSRVGDILAKHSAASQLRVMATASRLQTLLDEITDLAASQMASQFTSDDPNEPTVDTDTQQALIRAREKELRRAVFVSIQDWYRDLLILSTSGGTAPAGSLCFEEHRAELVQKASKIQPRLALRYIEFAQNIEQQIELRNMQPPTVFIHWFTWMP